MAFEQLFLRRKTKIGSVSLDCVVSERHQKAVVKTKSPVEFGVEFTDHSYVTDDIITIVGRVTDTPFISQGGNSAFVDSVTNLFGSSNSPNYTRSQRAYSALELLLAEREPLQVITNLKTYPSLLLVGLDNQQTADNPRALDITMTFEESRITYTSVGQIDPTFLEAGNVKNQGSPNQSLGRNAASKSSNASLLKQVSEFIKGF